MVFNFSHYNNDPTWKENNFQVEIDIDKNDLNNLINDVKGYENSFDDYSNEMNCGNRKVSYKILMLSLQRANFYTFGLITQPRDSLKSIHPLSLWYADHVVPTGITYMSSFYDHKGYFNGKKIKAYYNIPIDYIREWKQKEGLV